MDQLPRLGKRELICLLSFTCNYVVFVWRGFLFLWVLGMGYVILLWHSLSLPYNYSTLYRCLFVPETKNRKSNFMLILCSVYAIMLVSEIFEYLGSGLKVPTEINGFLLSIDASLYQKRKLENLILC